MANEGRDVNRSDFPATATAYSGHIPYAQHVVGEKIVSHADDANDAGCSSGVGGGRGMPAPQRQTLRKDVSPLPPMGNTSVKSYTGFVPTCLRISTATERLAAARGATLDDLDATVVGDQIGTAVRSVTAASIRAATVEDNIGDALTRPYLAAAPVANASQVYGFRTTYGETVSSAGQIVRLEAGRQAEPDADLRPWTAGVSGYAGHRPHVAPTSVQWYGRPCAEPSATAPSSGAPEPTHRQPASAQ
ncbi:uncharacterized protein AMSG_02218 [Thecamonas trahens ATCC 50062]|uniref:Uncharacterized protein n=1 Tax=Thecamonas trahens ATCC 50062 TaxID=461836 RepID=A0A0L0DVB4_THETB|nr:hypothetical protein AMSG_02218 [Thecamonas trahens ATCC 50062]KNC56249.1 hypothetical protein AMSG_02218 [Thecamonas trahens ATCC 50062]|eukprot:XP_013760771.1 hypothetical protein AMSG_02218 [Thecamonas trahens ATCC 50062]